jgi:hypothetical protein
MKRTLLVILGGVVLAAAAGEARALIDPKLQPFLHLWPRYNAVIGAAVARRDEDNGTMTLSATHVFKGAFKPEQVHVTTVEATRDAPIFILDNQPVVAFVGEDIPGHEKQILFYTGNGVWDYALLKAPDGSRWEWTRREESQALGTPFGCFNGDAGQFLEMMMDVKAGRGFFPPRPFIRFREGMEIGRFAKAVRGVALYDIDGDGRCDVYACCEAGNRAYLQTGPLEFADRTEALGLSGVASASCSFADVNADGRADLLAGGVIYLGGPGGFTRSVLLPPEAAENVKSSAFVELNGDGYPDVVVSKVAGGLRAYLNGGEKGGAFRDATAELGLAAEAAGAGRTGFFAPGDWNDDGRCDLFYAAAGGLLLIQDDRGVFHPKWQSLGIDLSAFGAEAGMTGAGSFAPLWRPGRLSLVVPCDASFVLLVEENGRMGDAAAATNELQNEPTEQQLLCLTEDLNADGRVDCYTATRAEREQNTFHANRGYGSFMTSGKYNAQAFPAAHGIGALGAAAGDVNGDGANDLLLGGIDGRLRLMVNDTLAARTPPTKASTYHARKLYDASILSVRVAGRLGVLGAKVTLADAAGRVVALRYVGGNVNTGCRGPDTLNIAAREPGTYVLAVRFADGLERSWPVTLRGASKRVTLTADRDAPAPDAAAGDGGNGAGGGSDSAGAAGGDPDAPRPGDSSGGDRGGMLIWLWVVGAAVVIAALLAGVLIHKRRGNG